jgi:large subunit ribosomal protein L1
MNRQEALTNIQELRKHKTPRKFTQMIDVVVNLQDLNFKNPAHNVDFFLTYPHDFGRKRMVCALVGPELEEQAKQVCDLVVVQRDFDKYQKNKKLAKKLARDYDFFIAQANIMTAIAATFGRVFGPKGKMPNPKAGAVVPANANLKPVYDRLQKTVRVQAKGKPTLYAMIGLESQTDENLAENLFNFYDQLIHHLPAERRNIKAILIKYTMGKPIKAL